MSEAAERPDQDVPPFRYTAALAGDIEQRWQDYWEARGTFRAPNPVSTTSVPREPTMIPTLGTIDTLLSGIT